MKAAATLAVLGAIASSVTAFVNPTDPWSTSVWKPNTKVTILWTDDPKTTPSLKTNPLVNIYFMTGSDLVQTQLAVVAENYNALTNTSIVYDVPVVDPPGQIYFLKFVSAGGQAAEPAFTTRFTVTDAAGNPGTLKPTGSPNPGGNGTIVSQPAAGSTPTGASPSASGSAGSGSTASPTGKPTSGAGSLGASMTVAVAAVLGAVALAAF
ncbi:hypothetical protein BGZ68_008790 [Mortierella alpina]|nr:hypothetical protein BGZ68_008790 [Mortierella alpina]